MTDIKAILLPAAALFFAALACGGAEPITMNEIVVYPEAVPLEAGNIVADSITESLKMMAGGEVVDIEVRLFNVPADTSWDEIKLFYSTRAAAADWNSAGDLSQETDFVSTIGWRRGGLTRPQGFVVAYSVDPLGGPSYLFHMLFSE